MICLTTQDDIPRLQEIFDIAKQFMAKTGNPNQWSDSYPSIEQLTTDIKHCDSYVCVDEGCIVGTFVLREGIDPTYNVIYQGAWLNNRPYATLHRIASSGQIKGIFDQIMSFALQKHCDIRIDTHRDNSVMQKLILRHGFIYCGIIKCWNGEERLAYQLCI